MKPLTAITGIMEWNLRDVLLKRVDDVAYYLPRYAQGGGV